MEHTTCDKCGMKRNAITAPECPTCKFGLKGNNRKQPYRRNPKEKE